MSIQTLGRQPVPREADALVLSRNKRNNSGRCQGEEEGRDLDADTLPD
jgi:hypothetical protein